MNESRGTWLKGCAWGCAGVIACAALGVAWMTVSVRALFNEAHDQREILETRLEAGGGHMPSATGAVPPDRIERFLAVRASCETARRAIAELDGEAAEFEALAENGEPAVHRALPAAAKLTGAMIRLPWLLGELERCRNRALVDAGMSRGEYTYIYSIAFLSDRMPTRDRSSLFDADASNLRVRNELRSMLQRQLVGARRQLPDDDPWLVELATEVERLETDGDGVPWENGLPAPIADSLAPYRSRLDASYSAAAAEFELLNSSITAGGLQISME